MIQILLRCMYTTKREKKGKKERRKEGFSSCYMIIEANIGSSSYIHSHTVGNLRVFEGNHDGVQAPTDENLFSKPFDSRFHPIPIPIQNTGLLVDHLPVDKWTSRIQESTARRVRMAPTFSILGQATRQ